MANPRGLCCLTHHSNTFVLACPGLQRGQIRIEHFGLNMTKLIQAHDNHIACLTLTLDGLLLATASTKGTLIRIFNTMDGTHLQEVASPPIHFCIMLFMIILSSLCYTVLGYNLQTLTFSFSMLLNTL